MTQDACQTKASAEAIFLPLRRKKLQPRQREASYTAQTEYGSAREATSLVEGPNSPQTGSRLQTRTLVARKRRATLMAGRLDGWLIAADRAGAIPRGCFRPASQS